MSDQSEMDEVIAEFLVESKPLARKLHDAHLNVFTGDEQFALRAQFGDGLPSFSRRYS